MNNLKSINSFFFLTKRDLINKLNYRNIEKIPFLNKGYINAGSKGSDIKLLAPTALLVELLVNKQVSLKKCRTANLFLKIKKGSPAGVALKIKKAELKIFLFILMVEIGPGLKDFDFNFNRTKNQVSFTFKKDQVKNLFEVKQTPEAFKTVEKIDFSIVLKNDSNTIESKTLFSPVLL